MVRVAVSRVSGSRSGSCKSPSKHEKIESFASPHDDHLTDDVGVTQPVNPLTMDLEHSPGAKRIRAKVREVIREGDVGGTPLTATTSATVHLLRIDPFGRIASAVDVADTMSIACYVADGSCVEQGPSDWQRAA